jgi:APA family basic amino acid/polyamine antiporter
MSKNNLKKIGAVTGISLVVANMIGTGVFTSLGYQLGDLSNTAVILALWITGGLMALAGAFSYAEIGTAIKKSGGEYAFLSEIFHPVIGYLSGWISLTVGFAAPIALSSIAFIEYFPVAIPHARIFGIAIILGITFIHTLNLNVSSKFQNITTLLKVLLIAAIVLTGLLLPAGAENAINFETPFFQEFKSTAFAVSLIYVTYSYSGWNAAAYITGEFRNPVKDLPKALITGTLVVTVLYTLLQFVFLKHVPFDGLAGKLNVGTIAIEHMLGNRFAMIFSGAISLLLVSGISAMVWVGPRVTSSIANDYALWQFFRNNANGIPVKALWFQAILSSVLLLSGTFEQILIYCGILLNISALLTVTGVFKLRHRNKTNKSGSGQFGSNKNDIIKDYKSPLYPYLQLFFILICVWIIGFTFVNSPKETFIGALNLLVGLATYFISKRIKKKT